MKVITTILLSMLTLCCAPAASVKLQWAPSITPGCTYIIYAGQNPNFTTNLLGAPVRQDCGTNIVTIVGVPDGHWWFAAQAVNDKVGFPSDLSNLAEFATNSPPVESVSPPFNLQAASPSKRKVVLNWSSSTTPGVTLYRVYQGTSSGDFVEKVKLFDAGATSYTATGLSSRKTYWFAVSAATPAFESHLSPEVSVRVK